MVIEQTSELTSRLEKGEAVCFSFQHYNKNTIRFINSLVTKILSRNNIIYLQKPVETVIRELIINAIKANSKRVFFQHMHLDINNDTHYSRGMEQFKSFILDEQNIIEEELIKSPYRVKVYMKKVDRGVKIYIKNNAPILPIELQRIKHRIEMAHNYHDFSEVYCDVLDDEEGEGLGIILTILFLRNSGIGEKSFAIAADRTGTMSSLTIPYETKPAEITNRIKLQIMEEIEELPTFPENILILQNMCRTTESSVKEIADRVLLDPALSAAVLRLANTAGFITRKRPDNIHEAIMVIGLKNLYALLIASSVRKILDDRYSMYKQIWNHCNRVAFYGRSLALNEGRLDIAEHVFLAGLLHDLGKIVLLSTSSGLSEWISDIAASRKLSTSTVLEEVSIGISHSTIGGMISEKWRLPEYLTETITFHHSPFLAGSYRDIVDFVYIANAMSNIEEKKNDYYYLEEEILNKLSLNDYKYFCNLHERLQKRYDDHLQELTE